MGAGKVAPAALMVSAEAPIAVAPANNVIQRICLFHDPRPFVCGDGSSHPLFHVDALELGHAPGSV